jgi:hypothetical protein
VAADFKEHVSLFFTPHLKICEEIGKVRLLFQARPPPKKVLAQYFFNFIRPFSVRPFAWIL